jgi:DNA-binding MarR family transcriptional regulator
MNTDSKAPSPGESGHYRSLQILDELSNNDALTQRDLSKRLGIALGLVNSYIKNLVAKGYITVSTIPTKRYGYYLTPKGFAEKTRLAYDLLQDYTRIYREAKNNYRKLFHDLEQAGSRKVLFAGADEVAEFAYITLQDTGLGLAGIVDDDRSGEKFFGRDILPVSSFREIQADAIVVTSYVRRDAIVQALRNAGAPVANIHMIFSHRG